MANEVTASGSLKYDDGIGPSRTLDFSFVQTITTKQKIENIQSIGTSEEAIQMSEITAPGWGIFINLDPTNYIELRLPGTGASNDSIKLPARDANGKPTGVLIMFGSDCTAPYAIANTAACKLQYMIIST